MGKIERGLRRKVLEDPGPKLPAPPPSLRGASYGVREVTAENLLAATGELRDRQDKLSRATAGLIGAVKEAGEGPLEAGPGLTEEALLRWLRVQVARMEDMKESLDQKRRELALRTPVGDKKGKEEEWVLEERRRLRQQVRRDQDERAPEQGRGEGGIRTSGPSGAPSGQAPASSGSHSPQPRSPRLYTPSPPLA